MKNITTTDRYCTPYQLKLPLEISKKIKISDPVYTFCEVFDHIDLNKHLAVKESKIGRKRYDSEILLKVILFAFVEFGYVSTREIERLCNNDIRFMWLLQDNPAPSHMTIDNFMKDSLAACIEDILDEINSYIFEMENVDLSHIYIDGTKIVAMTIDTVGFGRKAVRRIDKRPLTRLLNCFKKSILLSYIRMLNLKFVLNIR